MTIRLKSLHVSPPNMSNSFFIFVQQGKDNKSLFLTCKCLSQWNPINHGKCPAKKFQTCKLIDVVTVSCKFSLEFWVLWHNNMPINSFVKDRKFHGIKITWLSFYWWNYVLFYVFVGFFFFRITMVRHQRSESGSVLLVLATLQIKLPLCRYHSHKQLGFIELDSRNNGKLWYNFGMLMWIFSSMFHCACMSDTLTQHSWWISVLMIGKWREWENALCINI